MRRIIFLLIIFFQSENIFANSNIVYLDVQYIIDSSNLGKFYKNKINLIKKSNKLILDDNENQIKKKEIELNNQKNIIKEDEINKKVKELNDLVQSYQLLRQDFNKKLSIEKKNYTAKILSILNPLLTKYVEENNISLVIEKKNVLVGIKTLDITNIILGILDEETKIKKLTDDNQ